MNFDLFITCHPRISPILAEEMASYGFSHSRLVDKGVHASGSFGEVMQMNLQLRTANRVLVKLSDFKAKNATQLYQEARDYPWEELIDNESYFSIHSLVHNDTISDNRFANQKLKDAIVDRLREKTGKRPNTGSDFEGAVFYLLWINEEVKLYLDSSGRPLSRRAYRRNPWKAPLNESLAAALVLASGWTRNSSFINPMCGSGTLAIEAALMGHNKPPNLDRENYSFMHTRFHNSATWRMVRNKAISEVKSRLPVKIVATDRSADAIKATQENAFRAGVGRDITTLACDFSETEIPGNGGVVILNPEYGERLGDQESLADVYAAIGDFLKNKCFDNKGYIFTGNLKAAKSVGLRTSSRTPFYNGKIDCRLLEYNLYRGSLNGQFDGRNEHKEGV